MAFVYQGQNDCALVSIANYTGATYDEVVRVAITIARVSPETIRYRGVTHNEITLILFGVTKKVWRECKPRRGQYKINGVISWHHPNVKNGHMTACIDGHVFDTNGHVSTVEQYKLRHNFCIRKVWTDK